MVGCPQADAATTGLKFSLARGATASGGMKKAEG